MIYSTVQRTVLKAFVYTTHVSSSLYYVYVMMGYPYGSACGTCTLHYISVSSYLSAEVVVTLWEVTCYVYMYMYMYMYVCVDMYM